MPELDSQFQGVQLTSLLTLRARALDARSKRSILGDRFADSAVAQLEAEGIRFTEGANQTTGLALRAKAFDDWTRAFLEAHRRASPPAQVVHLGCGLDARVLRIVPDENVRWLAVDYPSVLALSNRLYPLRPSDYRQFGGDVLTADWLHEAPPDRPTLVVAEGLFCYFTPEQATPLLNRIVAHFSGGEIVFDAYNALGVWIINRHLAQHKLEARLRWPLGDPRSLEALVPGLKFVDELTRYPDADVAQIPWLARSLYRAWSWFPLFRRIGRLVRYRFGERAK